MRPDIPQEQEGIRVIVRKGDRDARTAAEYSALCETLRASIEEDRLPPDEASLVDPNRSCGSGRMAR